MPDKRKLGHRRACRPLPQPRPQPPASAVGFYGPGAHGLRELLQVQGQGLPTQPLSHPEPPVNY